MNNVLRIILTVIAVVLGIKIALWVVSAALALVFKIAIPVLILGGIAYVVYSASGGKSLLGGRKTLP
jgi:hypothetical protein